MMRRFVVMAFIGVGALALAIWVALRPATPPPAADTLELARLLGRVASEGYARAERPRRFEFPGDHGPHPRFRSEWWYFTGNLRDDGGRRFGYELAVFRIALAPTPPRRNSAWATNQVYMAHLALTDVAGARFRYRERFARGAVGLAGAQAVPFRVWIEDWEIAGHGFPWRLQARGDDFALELTLAPAKPVVLQGEGGLSRKGAAAGNASYYYSIPRLHSVGTLTLDGRPLPVSGESWLDREWSTSALDADQVGWDWFGLQLDNGYELMLYRLRRRDGSIDPHSAGSLIAPDGTRTALAADDVRWEILSRWSSPHGGTYPARWRLHVPRARLTLDVNPVLADQELRVTPRYWEGAVDVAGDQDGRRLNGRGYMELTGYAESARRR